MRTFHNATRYSRREALSIAAGTAATMAMGALIPARAQSAPHTFKLGDAEITIISDGGMSLPISFVLPKTEPKLARELLTRNALGADAYAAQINVVIVKAQNALIVIDSGGSTDFMPTMGQFADRLEPAGITPENVTHVIFTHAHPDHFWGLIDPLDDDTRFSNARHILTAAERDHWLRPGMEDSLPESMKRIAVGTARRMRAIAKRIDPVAPESEVLPGITLLSTSGHTPGHTSVLLTFGGQSLLVGGDALSHPVISFEQPDWIWGADLDPQMAIATRKRLLDHLATDRIPLLGYHLPWPGLGRVERSEIGFRFVRT